MTTHHHIIPEGSHLRRLANGDILLTLPAALVPYLCVPASIQQPVRFAFLNEPVEPCLEQVAREFVFSQKR